MFSPAQFQPAQLWPFIWHISLCLPIAAAVARAALSGSSGSPQCLFVFAKLIFLLLVLLFLCSPSLSIDFDYNFNDGLGTTAVTFAGFMYPSGNKIVFKIPNEVGAF